MNDHRPTLRDLLKEHDPARGSEGLSGEERALIRRAVVRAAGEPTPRGSLVPLWAAAGVVAALAIGAGLAIWPRPGPAPSLPAPDTAGVDETTGRSRRELHIVTPGGTQVVWVLDSEFRL